MQANESPHGALSAVEAHQWSGGRGEVALGRAGVWLGCACPRQALLSLRCRGWVGAGPAPGGCCSRSAPTHLQLWFGSGFSPAASGETPPKSPRLGARWGRCRTLLPSFASSPGAAAGAAEQSADHQVGAAAAVCPASLPQEPGACLRELHLQPEEAAGVCAGGEREAGERGALPQGPGARVQVQVSSKQRGAAEHSLALTAAAEPETRAAVLAASKNGGTGRGAGQAAAVLGWLPLLGSASGSAMDWEKPSAAGCPQGEGQEPLFLSLMLLLPTRAAISNLPAPPVPQAAPDPLSLLPHSPQPLVSPPRSFIQVGIPRGDVGIVSLMQAAAAAQQLPACPAKPPSRALGGWGQAAQVQRATFTPETSQPSSSEVSPC